MTMSANALTILAAVAAVALSSKEVAANTGLALPVVTGSLAGLKKLGFVEMVEGKIALTEAGRANVVPTEHKKVNKADIAKTIFAEMFGHFARKEVIAAFKEKAGLTQRGSETYYYNLSKAAK